jgi:hypothetical protein
MPTNTGPEKYVIVLNLTPGDGEGNLVENSDLLSQMEDLADGGKTLSLAMNILSKGSIQNSSNQYQWVIDSAKLTAAKDLIDTFIGNHVFAETPSYYLLPISASN